jgi:hypothetical protein
VYDSISGLLYLNHLFLYVHTIAGGGFTGLHQDGNGTVDSGHTVLQGHNEVIVFRRTNETESREIYMEVTGVDGLCVLPHNTTGCIKTRQWPTVKMIANLKAKG